MVRSDYITINKIIMPSVQYILLVSGVHCYSDISHYFNTKSMTGMPGGPNVVYS